LLENMVELVGLEPTTSSLRTMESAKKAQFGVHLTTEYGPKRSNSNRLAGSCLTTFLAWEKKLRPVHDLNQKSQSLRRSASKTTLSGTDARIPAGMSARSAPSFLAAHDSFLSPSGSYANVGEHSLHTGKRKTYTDI